MAYFCHRCGNRLEDGTAACDCCGAPVRTRREAAHSHAARTGRKTPAPFPLRKLLPILGAAAAVVLLVLILSLGGKTVNLDKYVEVTFSGYDGYGTAQASFDYERFYKDCGRKIRIRGNNGLSNWSDPAEALLMGCVSGSLDQSRELSNGDKVTYVWSCNDAEAQRLFGVKLKHSDKSFKVKGLEKAATFDAFADLDVSFSGGDGYGSLVIENKAASGSPAGHLNYSADREHGLSNGDKVTVTASYGWYDGDEMASALIRQFGAVPAEAEKTYTVSGLSPLETFDPFANIEFNLSGISGSGSISAVVIRDEAYMESVYVSFDKDIRLSNGDDITAAIRYGSCSDESVIMEYAAREYGMVPSELKKTFRIEGLPHYVRDLEDLPAAAEQTMKQQLEDVVRSYAARSWVSNCTIESMEHVGNYVLWKKDSKAYGRNNSVVIVYQINARVQYPDDVIDQMISYYYPLDYQNVVVDDEGNFVSGEYVTPSKQFDQDFGSHSLWYYGYTNLQDLYSN